MQKWSHLAASGIHIVDRFVLSICSRLMGPYKRPRCNSRIGCEQSNGSIGGQEWVRATACCRPSSPPHSPVQCYTSLLRVQCHYSSHKHVETGAPHLAKRSLSAKAAMRRRSPWRAGSVWGVIQTFAKPITPLNLPGCPIFTLDSGKPSPTKTIT